MVQAVQTAPVRRAARNGRVEHPSPGERAARGKAARSALPRSAHAGWSAPDGRRDPVAILAEQDATRVEELVPLRHSRMLVSPFTFYRGAAAIMAADLAHTPTCGITVQLCGDAHLSNFGVFAAPDRRLVFDINDFDETLPGPFEWDVKRMVASFAVAARDRGFDRKTRKPILLAAARGYREAMREFGAARNMDVWYARLDVDEFVGRFGAGASAKEIRRFEANVAKARAKGSGRALAKLTRMQDGEPRFISEPPLITPVEDLLTAEDRESVHERARGIVRAYRRTLPEDRRRLIERYRYVHAARKVVGVGSVGTRAWVMLLLGRDGDDPLFLQFKEAQRSVLEPYLAKSRFDNCGRRVVEGQRLMQSASDILLGWIRVEGLDGVERDFYVRQLWDAKGSALVELMRPSMMGMYAHTCAWTLARAHARSGDAIAIGAYLGGGDAFDRALAEFAEDYADQNERDHAAMAQAVASGQVAADPAG
jgi:uncharacterized protein (DUF2252 family)